METVHLGFAIALALTAGDLAQSVASHLHIPGIGLLLDSGLAWDRMDSIGSAQRLGTGSGRVPCPKLASHHEG